MMTLADLRYMPLHQQAVISDHFRATRVPGGLVYQMWSFDEGAVAMVFVPLEEDRMKPNDDEVVK